MGIFDKLGESIVETGQEIRKMADQNSLQGELRKKNKELETLVYQIGLEMISGEPDICAEKCPERFARLLQAREQAKMLRNQIALMNVQIICPGCGRTIKGASQFCVYCGSRLPEPVIDFDKDYDIPDKTDAATQTQNTCSKCGVPLKPGAAFCINCGSPIQSNGYNPRVCKNCGAELQEGTAFCTNCGTPV